MKLPAALLALLFSACANSAARPLGPSDASEPHAVEIVQASLERMGGWPAWCAARHLHWTFFGRREHWWDKHTGDVRITSGELVILMNVTTKKGRAIESGVEVTEPAALDQALEKGFAWWVNDSYWVVMPWKLFDPGVVLREAGAGTLADGRAGHLVDVTFEGVGLTPANRYVVAIASDTGRVEQWSFYASASDTEPKFTLPWTDWKELGGIWLATGHGEGELWPTEVLSEAPAGTYTQP
jgi:hypothetical protein